MSADNHLLPWIEANWRRLAERRRTGCLPHAMLVTGKSGVGKSSFSRFAAQSFLCRQVDPGGYCGRCESCLLFEAATHPDFLPLEPEEKKTIIGVDQVRELIDELELTPQCSQSEVAVVDPADSMNLSAANCLLKTLEEPASANVILLVCSTPGFLPATIRSRCQTIALSVDSHQCAVDWLLAKEYREASDALAMRPDAPLTVLGLADGKRLALEKGLFDDLLALLQGRAVITAVAAGYAGENTRSILALLSSWVSGAIKVKMGCGYTNPQGASRRRISALATNLVS